MSVFCLTGWQQPANALAEIAPEALHFDYSVYHDAEAALRALPGEATLAIGWSLGGQLLLRAVSAGYTKPRALLLLATPFQYCADALFPGGMAAEAALAFREAYAAAPEKTLRRFQALLCAGEEKATSLTRKMSREATVWPHGFYWLERLMGFSCGSLDFSAFPERITLVQGAKDRIVPQANALKLADALPQARSLLWPEASHLLHLHDADALRGMVNALT
jgi:pimeloyl-ACP methyl ester carboxylesterase